MGNIYAIVILDIAKNREFRLSSLLGDANAPMKYEFFLTKGTNLVKSFSFRVKTYKTVSGAEKEVMRLNKMYSTKNNNKHQIKLSSGQFIDGKWNYYLTFDSYKYSFSYVSVTDIWRKNVKDEIEKEKKRHMKEMEKLNKKLI